MSRRAGGAGLRRSRRLMGVAVALAATACVPLAGEPVAAPPYRPADSPGPWAEVVLPRDDGSSAELADPDVVRVGDRWFLYGTTSEAGFESWSSDDLRTWRYEGFVWRPTPGSWNDHGGTWAPHVHADDDGTFLLYYTAARRIGVARSTTPAGPFVDLLDHPLVGGGHGGVGDGTWVSVGQPWVDLVLDSDESAIDAFVLDTSSGERILYFSSSPTFGASTISAVRLLDDAVVAPGPATQVLSTEVAGWEGIVREGAWVEEHGGHFVLSYSGSPYLTTCYALGQAVAAGPLGPFTRVGDGPFLHDDPAIGVYGPGHHSLTTGPGGGSVMFFHTRDTPVGEERRQTRWAEVVHAPDGTIRPVDPPGATARGRSSCWPFPL